MARQATDQSQLLLGFDVLGRDLDGKLRRRALCHPEKRYCARGLCSTCYMKAKAAGTLPPLLKGTGSLTVERMCHAGCGHVVTAPSGAWRVTCAACRPKEEKRRNASYRRAKGAVTSRFNALRRSHGLTREEYEALLRSQGGRCLGCGDISDRLHVDHDHACCPPQKSCEGCRRGLLCGDCNRLLGLAKDRRATLYALAAYLGRY